MIAPETKQPPDWQVEAAEFAGYLVQNIALNHRVPRCDVWKLISYIATSGEQMDPERHWEF